MRGDGGVDEDAAFQTCVEDGVGVWDVWEVCWGEGDALAVERVFLEAEVGGDVEWGEEAGGAEVVVEGEEVFSEVLRGFEV